MAYGVFGDGFGGSCGQAHEVGPGGEAQDGNGHDGEGVFVAEHGSLAEHLAVGHAHGELGGLLCGHACGAEHGGDAGDVVLVGEAAGDGVGGELDLVGLGGAGEEGGEHGGSGAATEVAGEVGEAGDLVGFGAGDANVVKGADGDEDEGESCDLEHAPEGDGSEAGVEREASEVVEAGGGGGVSEDDEEAGIDFAYGATGDHHHDDQDEATWGEDHSGAFGGVAEEGLEVLGDEDGGAEEDHAEDELEEDGGAEVTVAEEA